MPNLATNQIERNIAKENGIKDIRNLFRLKREKDNCIKDKIIRDTRTLFESEEEDYYQRVRISNVFNNNIIEYESSGDKDKTPSIDEYLDKTIPYLTYMINNLKTQGKWKIQLALAINFFPKDSNETRIMHSKSNNIEIMIANETDEIIKELFESLLQKYQKGLEESMKDSDAVFHSVDLLHYKCHIISLNRDGSYIDFPDWLKSKKATINPENNDEKCFQYAVTVALNHKNIVKDLTRTSKIKPFTDQYNWKEISFFSYKKDWEKFEINNKTIALNILNIPHNREEKTCIHFKG